MCTVAAYLVGGTENYNVSGTEVTTDILGNRLVYGSSTYSWDALNRMTSLAKSGTTTNYEYRADGMRTHKSSSSTNFTEYFHDAQMSMEDSDLLSLRTNKMLIMLLK